MCVEQMRATKEFVRNACRCDLGDGIII